MPADRRGADEIRREIADERERLASALADLQHSVRDRRRLAAVSGAGFASLLAASRVLRAVRRRGRG